MSCHNRVTYVCLCVCVVPKKFNFINFINMLIIVHRVSIYFQNSECSIISNGKPYAYEKTKGIQY